MWTYHITQFDGILFLVVALLLVLAYRGLTTGKSVLIYRDVTRSEDGLQYWLAIWLELAAAAVSLSLVLETY